MKIEDQIQDLLLDRYHNPHENSLCNCGKGTRIVRCRYDGCFQSPTTCIDCFVTAHKYNPFHWALLWDVKKRIWVRRGLSDLSADFEIQLGHVFEQEKCSVKCSGTKEAIPFIITHINGVHNTRIRFCGCLFAPEKHTQLIQSELFPATVEEPRSAFTFAVLKQFNMHNLQSKCGAFDYVLSLRRLTDNVFTARVAVSLNNDVRHSLTRSRTCTRRFWW